MVGCNNERSGVFPCFKPNKWGHKKQGILLLNEWWRSTSQDSELNFLTIEKNVCHGSGDVVNNGRSISGPKNDNDNVIFLFVPGKTVIPKWINPVSITLFRQLCYVNSIFFYIEPSYTLVDFITSNISERAPLLVTRIRTYLSQSLLFITQFY